MWWAVMVFGLPLAVLVYMLCRASGDYDRKCEQYEQEQKQLKKKKDAEEHSSWFE